MSKIRKKVYKAGYIWKKELVELLDSPPFERVACYTPNGDYIGSHKDARFLCVKRGLSDLQKTNPSNGVCSIGFSKEKQKWFGWSHRAICGFGIGDRIFEEGYGDDETFFTQHGSKTIKTLEDAKKAASAFAEYMS